MRVGFSRFMLFVALIAVSCGRSGHETQRMPSYVERHRPQIHFSPPANWMNDPNGMFYLDGEYHLFYQYYPDSAVWGPMHWGHAVTRDLVHWEHLPIALHPDTLGYIFSGSAVVDLENTSGFGSKDNPPVVAVFTYHDPLGERSGRNDYQSQAIAYSLDKGRSWTKYRQNPILSNPGIRDFRDPKVSWIDEAGQWVMTLAVTDHIEFYGSHDLKSWSKLSEFGTTDGAHGGVWECPDLFKLTDEKGNSKFVLLVSINPGAPNGGSGTQYFIGDFDGTKFTSDTPGGNAGWVDYGTDNYAGVTWANIPPEDGRRIFIGWMSNWLYAEAVPTSPWRSAMTIPRTLELADGSGGYVLKSVPVVELNNLIDISKTIPGTEADTVRLAQALTTDESSPCEPGTQSWPDCAAITVPLMINGSVMKSNFRLELTNSRGQILRAGYDTSRNEFYMDRSPGMTSGFHRDFGTVMYAPRNSADDVITFVVIVDVASVEIFFDKGHTVITGITFPDEVFNVITLIGGSGRIVTGDILIHRLKSSW